MFCKKRNSEWRAIFRLFTDISKWPFQSKKTLQNATFHLRVSDFAPDLKKQTQIDHFKAHLGSEWGSLGRAVHNLSAELPI